MTGDGQLGKWIDAWIQVDESKRMGWGGRERERRSEERTDGGFSRPNLPWASFFTSGSCTPLTVLLPLQYDGGSMETVNLKTDLKLWCHRVVLLPRLGKWLHLSFLRISIYGINQA